MRSYPSVVRHSQIGKLNSSLGIPEPSYLQKRNEIRRVQQKKEHKSMVQRKANVATSLQQINSVATLWRKSLNSDNVATSTAQGITQIQ